MDSREEEGGGTEREGNRKGGYGRDREGGKRERGGEGRREIRREINDRKGDGG